MNPSGDFSYSDSPAPHRANTVLILGILSLVVCAPMGIAAWVMGQGDLRLMREGKMDDSGKQATQAGMICGIIGTALMVVSVIFLLITFLIAGLGVAGAAAAGG